MADMNGSFIAPSEIDGALTVRGKTDGQIVSDPDRSARTSVDDPVYVLLTAYGCFLCIFPGVFVIVRAAVSAEVDIHSVCLFIKTCFCDDRLRRALHDFIRNGIFPVSFSSFFLSVAEHDQCLRPVAQSTVYPVSVRFQHPVFVVVCVEFQHESALLEIPRAGDCARFFPRCIQGRKKHASQDCYDSNYHKELYDGESAGFALER